MKKAHLFQQRSHNRTLHYSPLLAQAENKGAGKSHWKDLQHLESADFQRVWRDLVRVLSVDLSREPDQPPMKDHNVPVNRLWSSGSRFLKVKIMFGLWWIAHAASKPAPAVAGQSAANGNQEGSECGADLGPEADVTSVLQSAGFAGSGFLSTH
ncbi:uncharacterized protein [Narcine bancroftii]|uniref:uncharacterized protein isoform X2 n=1 Tax=Narcine bancroftii TaxID=1343680 RepID=UPI003832330D